MEAGTDTGTQFRGQDRKGHTRFAWWPRRTSNGRWLWLVSYKVRRTHFFDE